MLIASYVAPPHEEYARHYNLWTDKAGGLNFYIRAEKLDDWRKTFHSSLIQRTLFTSFSLFEGRERKNTPPPFPPPLPPNIRDGVKKELNR